jgi:hypothetical protein
MLASLAKGDTEHQPRAGRSADPGADGVARPGRPGALAQSHRRHCIPGTSRHAWGGAHRGSKGKRRASRQRAGVCAGALCGNGAKCSRRTWTIRVGAKGKPAPGVGRGHHMGHYRCGPPVVPKVVRISGRAVLWHPVPDRWRAYTWFPRRWRQVCWPPLLSHRQRETPPCFRIPAIR